MSDTVIAKTPKVQEKKPAPKERKQITIYIDREAELLCVKPRGTLEAAPRNEIIAFMKSPLGHKLLGPLLVEESVAICERYDWRLVKWEDGLPFTTPLRSGVDKIATMEKDV